MQFLLASALMLVSAAPSLLERHPAATTTLSRLPSSQGKPNKDSKKRIKRAAHVIRVIGARQGQSIADIGCGDGWLSAAIAKVVGPDGTVYAVEISESSLRQVRQRLVANIKPVLSKKNDVSLPPDSLDTALLHDVADHVQKSARPKLYAGIARALKSEGRLFIFDPHGKAERHLKELAKYGFVPDTDDDLTQLSKAQLDARLQTGIRFRHVEPKRDSP